MGHIVLTKNNFDHEVLMSSRPVLVDFWASWCPPCMALSPTIDEIAQEEPDLKVGKVNVDEEPELVQRFRIMSVPTLMVFKSGDLICQEVGGKSKEEILEMIGKSAVKA